MQINERILVRTTTQLSFTGIIIDDSFIYDDNKSLILKTSNTSSILMIIPYKEISQIFYMDGRVEDYNV